MFHIYATYHKGQDLSCYVRLRQTTKQTVDRMITLRNQRLSREVDNLKHQFS
jgi:hypothetical protein